jgi:O-antigen ligase
MRRIPWRPAAVQHSQCERPGCIVEFARRREFEPIFALLDIGAICVKEAALGAGAPRAESATVRANPGTGMLASIQGIGWRNLDLRALAEPLAILSPLALIVSGQEFVMSCVALLFVLHSWRIRDFSWMREGWFAALLALWVYALLRTLLYQPTATGVLVGLHWIHFGVYAAALARWILPDRRARDRLLYATAISLTFFACDTLLQYVAGFDIIGRPAWSGRLTSVFTKPYVGIEIAWLYLPALLGLWQNGRTLLAAAFGCVCAAAVLLSGDRMGLLVFVSSALLACAFYRALRRPFLFFLPVVAVVAGVLVVVNPNIYERQVASTLQVIQHVDQSNYGVVFKSAWDMARDYPVFGVGVHRYQAVCLDERYGAPLAGPHSFPRCEGHPHNIYLLWLVETGMIGLAGYIAFAGLSLIAIIRSASLNAGNAIFYALAAALVMRFWPLSAGTSFFSTWSAEPLFLILGWAMSYCPPAPLEVAGRPRPLAPSSGDHGDAYAS